MEAWNKYSFKDVEGRGKKKTEAATGRLILA